MSTQGPSLYPQDEMTSLVEALSAGAGVEAVDAALATSPEDPRLHFLRGSVLAGARRYPEARSAISHAVALAPEFTIARFQLGFLEFTSGEPAMAGRTWEPLSELASDHPLRLFAQGLMCLPADDIDGAVSSLRRGIELNTENVVLNRDMQLLIDELLKSDGTPGDSEPTSETEMLLRQLGAGTHH